MTHTPSSLDPDLDDVDDASVSEASAVHNVSVPASAAGTRLDRFLADALPDLSRTRIKALIEEGALHINGQDVQDAALKVKAGDSLVLCVPQAIDADPEPENIPLDIVYEDDDLLVINKAADMVVHPAIGHASGTLVNALLYHCGASLSGIGGVKRPGIVHRLDRGTSGLMMVAKNDLAHAGLQDQLQDRTLGRIYHAITCKVPIPPAGTIDKPIGRHPTQRLKMAVAGKDGRDAVTHYKVEARYGDAAALVACRLATGRTHQIRVHLASIGYPLIGDPLYGPQTTALQAALRRAGTAPQDMAAILSFGRQALHAHEIHFNHPRSGKAMSFRAPPPDDFADLMARLSRS